MHGKIVLLRSHPFMKSYFTQLTEIEINMHIFVRLRNTLRAQLNLHNSAENVGAFVFLPEIKA